MESVSTNEKVAEIYELMAIELDEAAHQLRMASDEVFHGDRTSRVFECKKIIRNVISSLETQLNGNQNSQNPSAS